MKFADLLAAVNTEAVELKKSQDEADAALAAVKPATPAAPAAGAAAAPANPDDDEDDDNPELVAKSLSFQLEDGTVVEAVDGTELVKSLMARQEADSTAVQQVLGATIDLVKSQSATIRSQGQLLKSLQDKVDVMSGQGRGRKTVLSVVERPEPATLRKSQGDEPQGMQREEFMAKALDMQRSGKLTGLDVARVEAALNENTALPSDVVSRVMAHGQA